MIGIEAEVLETFIQPGEFFNTLLEGLIEDWLATDAGLTYLDNHGIAAVLDSLDATESLKGLVLRAEEMGIDTTAVRGAAADVLNQGNAPRDFTGLDLAVRDLKEQIQAVP